MKLEVNKWYLDRSGDKVKITTVIGKAYFGYFHSNGVSSCWKENCQIMYGRDGECPGDLVSLLDPQPFIGWMVQARGQDPIPVANEELARSWASKYQGRAFQVMEVIE